MEGILEFTTPVGNVLLAASESGLTHLLFVDGEGQPLRTPQRPKGAGSDVAERILVETERQLRQYFAGQRRAFDLPLAPDGTTFQLQVWKALNKISFGQVASYSTLAQRIGRPRAIRAVGAANGANPISIIVPCHRVVGQNLKLTGYGGGLEAKRWLLELEGISFKGDRLAPYSEVPS